MKKIKIKGSMDTSDITESLQQVSKKTNTVGGKLTGLFKNIGSRFVNVGIDLAIDAAWNGIIRFVGAIPYIYNPKSCVSY